MYKIYNLLKFTNSVCELDYFFLRKLNIPPFFFSLIFLSLFITSPSEDPSDEVVRDLTSRVENGRTWLPGSGCTLWGRDKCRACVVSEVSYVCNIEDST